MGKILNRNEDVVPRLRQLQAMKSHRHLKYKQSSELRLNKYIYVYMLIINNIKIYIYTAQRNIRFLHIYLLEMINCFTEETLTNMNE